MAFTCEGIHVLPVTLAKQDFGWNVLTSLEVLGFLWGFARRDESGGRENQLPSQNRRRRIVTFVLIAHPPSKMYHPTSSDTRRQRSANALVHWLQTNISKEVPHHNMPC